MDRRRAVDELDCGVPMETGISRVLMRDAREAVVRVAVWVGVASVGI